MQKLVWRLKLEADFGAGNTNEIEVARIEREALGGFVTFVGFTCQWVKRPHMV